ncbi:YbaB/EbfC family nucleoid-associated protein [Nocardia mexicana]|uniref:YbaB/EbfC DNA-binding family protein n=1 Tax=Nocardia mexicana TaxID=279262 RepID=A0A370GIW9_9NOCA|nr:YbaB/EbfC family nucleoid-associated protein [Nocardia mexicana]RDI43611.1 YbaB/EbfC DNA-binding family protein [Nocardia mexicana]
MANETLKTDLADLLETVNDQIRSLEEAHRQRAQLTATASVYEGRVRVTVNADSVVVQTRFADDIDDLTFSEIAEGVTAAAQAAAAEVTRRAEKLIEPMRRARSRLPTLSDLVEGLPDLQTKVPEPVRAPTDVPVTPGRARSEEPRDHVTGIDRSFRNARIFDDGR